MGKEGDVRELKRVSEGKRKRERGREVESGRKNVASFRTSDYF